MKGFIKVLLQGVYILLKRISVIGADRGKDNNCYANFLTNGCFHSGLWC